MYETMRIFSLKKTGFIPKDIIRNGQNEFQKLLPEIYPVFLIIANNIQKIINLDNMLDMTFIPEA